MSAGRSGAVPVLDGLRGLAALIVMVSHGANTWFQGALLGNGAGQVGVMLFFVLSGFLMAHLYLHQTWTAAQARRFAFNRFGRVVPLFVAVVLFSFAAQQAGAPFWTYPIASGRDLALHLGLFTGVSVLWSIGPEILFYILFAGLWFAWSRSRAVALGLAGLALLASVLPLASAGAGNSLAELHQRLPYFLAGSALGALWTPTAWPQPGPRLRLALLALAALALVLCLPQVLLAWTAMVGLALAPLEPAQQVIWGLPLYWAVVVAFFAAMLWLSPAWLESAAMRKAGELSYGIYLTHMLVLRNLAEADSLPLTLRALLYVAGSVALAWALHVILERPARAWFRARAGSPATAGGL